MRSHLLLLALPVALSGCHYTKAVGGGIRWTSNWSMPALMEIPETLVGADVSLLAWSGVPHYSVRASFSTDGAERTLVTVAAEMDLGAGGYNVVFAENGLEMWIINKVSIGLWSFEHMPEGSGWMAGFRAGLGLKPSRRSVIMLEYGWHILWHVDGASDARNHTFTASFAWKL